jgi:protocatechuate 3,4-dioxygenase beta subunit
MACSGRPLRFLVISLGLWLQYAALDAQTSRGSVTGIVTDTQKAAVLNAKIELTGLGTNLTRTTRTNGSGLYRFEAVDPGAYKLTVQSIGFRTTVAPRVTVNAGLVTTEDCSITMFCRTR